MANDKITQLNTLNSNTVANDDLLIIVDVSSGISPTGETKNITFGALTSSVLNNIDSTDIPFLIASGAYSTYQAINDRLPISYTASVAAQFATLSSDDVINSSSISGSTVTIALNNISSSLNDKINISDVSASVVMNDSFVSGSTVKDALEFLKGYLSTPSSSAPAGGLSSKQSTTMSGGQTTYNLTQPVLVPNTLVYLNGVILSDSDYTLTSGSVGLNFSAAADDELLVIDYGTNASGSASASPVSIIGGLDDTPSSYGSVGQVLAMKSGSNELEWVTPPSGSPDNITIVETSGKLGVKDSSLTVSKFSNVSSNTVIGNLSGVPATPAEVVVSTGIVSASVNDTSLATTKAIFELVQNMVYPVGSIYTNADVDTDPVSLLGFGTWARFGQGRVLIGESAAAISDGTTEQTFPIGSTSGTYKHQLDESEMPKHNHGYTGADGSNNNQTLSPFVIRRDDPEQTFSANSSATSGILPTGGDQYHNNIQPYIVVYMWKRTA